MKNLAITLLTLLLLPSTALADFSIKFENTFDKKICYMLYWVDNPFELDSPFNMAGGELKALESREISPLKAGDYIVVWQGEGLRTCRVQMKINSGVTLVTVTPKSYVTR